MGDDQPRGETMDSALSDPATRVLVIEDQSARVEWDRAGDAGLVWETPREEHDVVGYLGTADDGHHLLLARSARQRPEDLQAGDPWPEGTEARGRQDEADARWLGLREAAPVLGREEATWLSTGIALMNWQDSNAFCPTCGSATTTNAGGWSQTCTAEGREIFPRTDPAVISAVVHTDEDGVDRLLLGNSAAWPADRYSTFAGFVEAGESLEAAVAREIYEESHVEVDQARYLGSQPWPFPRSLMVGFIARAVDRESATADGTEIRRVRWFTRAELREEILAGAVTLPGDVSIAHHLIAHWYGEPLPTRDRTDGAKDPGRKPEPPTSTHGHEEANEN